jgi:hypothetical protein
MMRMAEGAGEQGEVHRADEADVGESGQPDGARWRAGGDGDRALPTDEEAAAAYPFRLPGLQVLHREDGSVSDW